MLHLREGASAVTDTTTEEDQALGRAILVALALASSVAVYVLHAALPHNAITLPFEQVRTVQQLVPEGWAFFTRSPRTVYPTLYRPGPDGRWRLVSPETLATPDQAMGLARRQRSEGTAIALMLQQVPDDAWTHCTGRPADCLARSPRLVDVSNSSSHREICGTTGFVLQDVLPWAWRDSGTVMPSRVVAARVSC